MTTEPIIASSVDTANPSGLLLLTDDEIAAVGGAYTDKELPVLAIAGGLAAWGGAAYAYSAGYAAFVAGAAIVGAPLVGLVVGGALVIGGSVLIYEGLHNMS